MSTSSPSASWTAKGEGARHHLFRVESGEIILDLQDAVDNSGAHIQVIAVGGPGAEALLVPRAGLRRSVDLVAGWIRRLAQVIAGPNPSWEMPEVASDAAADIPPGERRRGPARSIIWVSLESGTAKPMGLDPTIAAGGPPLPLTSGMWIEAGQTGCTAVGSDGRAGCRPAVARRRSIPARRHRGHSRLSGARYRS